jgi:hypothetical protein
LRREPLVVSVKCGVSRGFSLWARRGGFKQTAAALVFVSTNSMTFCQWSKMYWNFIH